MSEVGRPKKTLEDLPENWKDIILNLKRDGGSDVECMAELNISRDLWYRFIKDEMEFSDTIKEGLILCEAWWLKTGREEMFQTSGGNITHKNLNPTLWYMNMKNRFGWKDKHEVDANISGGITVNIIKKL